MLFLYCDNLYFELWTSLSFSVDENVLDNITGKSHYYVIKMSVHLGLFVCLFYSAWQVNTFSCKILTNVMQNNTIVSSAHCMNLCN